MNATPRILHAAAITLTTAVLAACGSGDTDTRGQVVSVTQTSTIGKAVVDGLVATQSGLEALIGSRAACGVSLQKVVYEPGVLVARTRARAPAC